MPKWQARINIGGMGNDRVFVVVSDFGDDVKNSFEAAKLLEQQYPNAKRIYDVREVPRESSDGEKESSGSLLVDFIDALSACAALIRSLRTMFPSAAKDDSAKDEPTIAVRRLALDGPGEQIVLGITTVLGRAQFRKWGGEFERFMSVSQFRVIRSPAGSWSIEHCPEAVNQTNVDGVALAGPVALRAGMSISLGRACRCPIRVSFVE